MSADEQCSRTRVSDRDRAAAAERLAAGFAEGRLDLQEYDDRLRRVLTSRTRDDLGPAVADLPVSALARRVSTAERERRELREWLQQWRYWSGAAVLMVGIWGVQSLAQGQAREFWPGIPLGVWAVVLVAVAVWPSPAREGQEEQP